jgi:hypothetical protein
MPPVHRRPDPMTPTGLLASWLAAAVAVPLALFVAAAGQGLGALFAGCRWIGLSVPWVRQPWALVNQPVVNFAALPEATGYWLGSLVAPLAVAVLAIPLSLRLRSLTSQLLVVQCAWMANVVAVAWQPALDPDLSHVSRWLGFRGLPPELRWISIALAIAAAVPIVLRLIAIARITRYQLSRARRLGLVMLHLLPAPVAWAAATTTLHGVFELAACVAAGLPIAAVLAVAWIGYPAPLTHPVAAVGGRGLIALCGMLALAWGAFWIAGRPLPDHRAAAVQWGKDTSTNNIRTWMEPRRAPWLD